ncbi:uncharacterized protein LOC142399798 isoform X1 [Odontesthes bonariensis]|uniref:uncharacterized protein LOC142399798 isoform X1 n=1 Tax=Odontesthes bonariensis TaxID=219752 RepID=UPI003F5826ED
MPTSTPSTAMPTSTPSTAMPTSTPSTAMPTSTPSTAMPTSAPLNKTKLLRGAITLMCLDSFSVEVKKETFNIVLFASTPNFLHINKVVMIICSSFGILLDISSLVLLRLPDSYQVTLVALVSVVIVTTSIELVITLLPIGPSHELKTIFELALRVCFAFNHIFTIAVIFAGVIDLKDDQEEDLRKSWLGSVMIAYTVWIFLAELWDFELCINRRTILRGNKTESSKYPQRRDPQSRKCVGGVKTIVPVVSGILVAGTASFAAAVIGLLY